LVLGLSETASQEEILAALERRAPRAVIIDDAGLLVRPLIGGLEDVDRLVEFSRAGGVRFSWMFAIGTPAWHYLQRARGDRAVFDEVVRLRPWSEREIRALMALRSKQAGIAPRYDDLVVPRQLEASAHETSAENTQRDFARILWDYADGNPTIASHFFRESLGLRQGEIYVHLFRTPPLGEIEGLPSSVYFVLRSIVQLELAIEADIVSCTDLHPADVAAALRSTTGKHLVEREGERIRVALPWYRAVSEVLHRHHLLMRTI
jgi:hypothetical protein